MNSYFILNTFNIIRQQQQLGSSSPIPPVPSYNLIDENTNFIVTENSDNIVTESTS